MDDSNAPTTYSIMRDETTPALTTRDEPTMAPSTTHGRTHAHKVRPKMRHSQVKNHKDIVPVLRNTLKEWQHPMVKQLEEITGINRVKLFYIFCAFVTFWLMMGPGNQFLSNLIGVVYPAYQSVLAVRSQTKDDDTQWLIYWCSYALFTSCDFLLNNFAVVLPFYLVAKTLMLLYLALPQTYGAHNVYVCYVDPLVDWLDKRSSKFNPAEMMSQ